MSTKVIHVQDSVKDIIYVGRPTKWGNPFSHKNNTIKGTIKVKNRQEALERHKEWLMSDEKRIKEHIEALKDKTLACWCRPKDGFQGQWLCHAQTIAALCDGIEPHQVT